MYVTTASGRKFYLNTFYKKKKKTRTQNLKLNHLSMSSMFHARRVCTRLGFSMVSVLIRLHNRLYRHRLIYTYIDC